MQDFRSNDTFSNAPHQEGSSPLDAASSRAVTVAQQLPPAPSVTTRSNKTAPASGKRDARKNVPATIPKGRSVTSYMTPRQREAWQAEVKAKGYALIRAIRIALGKIPRDRDIGFGGEDFEAKLRGLADHRGNVRRMGFWQIDRICELSGDSTPLALFKDCFPQEYAEGLKDRQGSRARMAQAAADSRVSRGLSVEKSLLEHEEVSRLFGGALVRWGAACMSLGMTGDVDKVMRAGEVLAAFAALRSTLLREPSAESAKAVRAAGEVLLEVLRGCRGMGIDQAIHDLEKDIASLAHHV